MMRLSTWTKAFTKLGTRERVSVLIMSLTPHKVYLNAYEIGPNLVTNVEYLEFMEADGYHDFRHWHAEGWDWVKTNKVGSPMYWHQIDGKVV